MESIIRYNSTYGRVQKGNITWENNPESYRNSSTPNRLYSRKNRGHILKFLQKDPPNIGKYKVLKCALSPALRVARTPLNEYVQSNISMKTRNTLESNRSFGITSLENSRTYLGVTTNRSFLGTQVCDNKNSKALLSIKHKRNRINQIQLRTVQSVRSVDKTEKSLSLVTKGKRLLILKQYDDAISYFDKAYRLNQRNTEAMLYKGIAMMDSNKTSKAIQIFKEITGNKQNLNKSVYLMLGMAYMKSNNTEEALGALNSALKLDNTYTDALLDV